MLGENSTHVGARVRGLGQEASHHSKLQIAILGVRLRVQGAAFNCEPASLADRVAWLLRLEGNGLNQVESPVLIAVGDLEAFVGNRNVDTQIPGDARPPPETRLPQKLYTCSIFVLHCFCKYVYYCIVSEKPENDTSRPLQVSIQARTPNPRVLARARPGTTAVLRRAFFVPSASD